jgi:hypothetical protein
MNKDENFLSEAYDSIYEMAKNKNYATRMPSVERLSRTVKHDFSPEELEKRKVQAAEAINKSLRNLERNKDDIRSARDIINILKDFDIIGRTDFLVNDQEMTRDEILNKVLELTKDEVNDPELLKVHENPETFEKKKGLTIDQYLWMYETQQHNVLDKNNNPIMDAAGKPITRSVGVKVPRTNKEKTFTADSEHYYLFRDILDMLSTESTERSRREKTLGGSAPKRIYYFYKKFDVVSSYTNEVVGTYVYGNFTPNEKGIEMGFEQGNSFPTETTKKKLEEKQKTFATNEQILPCKTDVYVPESGRFDKGVFWRTNQFMGEKAPYPMPFNMPNPRELRGSSLEEVRFAVNHYEAKEAFEQKYPKDKYPALYKKFDEEDV